MRDILAVFSWWLLIQIIGLAAWPLAFRLLRFLPDRGYTAAKPLGLLLTTFVLWLFGSLNLMPNSVGGIVFALVLVAGASTWALGREGGLAALRDWLEQHRVMVAVYEALFLLAMCGWAAYRATTPAINSTEKPMEFAFLNAILRSNFFPPHDPWLAGYGISYYYFGYVMMALMTQLAATSAGLAYNVSHGLWFALIAGGAFGAAYSISNWKAEIGNWKPIFVGVLAAVCIVFLGNLEAPLEVAHMNGVGSSEFWRWLDIKDINGPAVSAAQVNAAQNGSLRYLWWWRASRVIHDYTLNGQDQEVIDEFPFFSFLNGDLHPHTLAYPFVFLAIALALNLYRGERQAAGSKTQDAGNQMQEVGGRSRWLQLASRLLHPAGLAWPEWLLYAICLGALGFLNTWDFPIYLGLVVAAFALRRWQEGGAFSDTAIVDAVVLGAVLGVTGFVLYAPFYVSFQSQARGILPNLLNGTRFPQFVIMFGQFAAPGTLLVLALASLRSQVSAWRFWLGALGWALVILLFAALIGAVLGLVSPDGRMVLQAWRTGEPIPGLGVQDVGTSAGLRLLDRLLDPWTALLLALTVVVLVKLLGQNIASQAAEAASSRHLVTLSPEQEANRPGELLREEGEGAEPLTSPSLPFVLLLFLFGAALALSVEFIFLADTFGTRMNTVFKFYYQVWALWGIGAVCALDLILSDRALWSPFRAVAGLVSALLILAGLVYPVLAISTTGDRSAPTLDGTAWVAQQAPDEYAAIQWLDQNVAGAPVILQAPGQSYHAEQSRVSAFTGLPTLVGWDYHELQWRGTYDLAGRHKDDATRLYTTRDAQETLTLLDKYAISYVYVGPAERSQFPAASLQKFDTLMSVAFQQGDVTIYKIK